jgi:hypothetical protein
MRERTESSKTPQPPATGSKAAAWRWPLVVVMLAILAFLGVREALQILRTAHEAAVEGITGLAEGFRTGTITTTFTAALPRFALDDSLKLELAAIEAVATFTRTDDRRIFYDLVRETSRRRVAELVRTWLLAEHHWTADRFSAIRVLFADDPAKNVSQSPTLSLQPAR